MDQPRSFYSRRQVVRLLGGAALILPVALRVEAAEASRG
jgi:hypothetical protein